MKDIEQINLVLAEYKLTAPVSPADQRKINRSKKKTLAVILGVNGKSTIMTALAVKFYYIIQGFGMKVTLLTGARAAVFASVAALVVVAGTSVMLLQNNLYNRGVIAVYEVQKKGSISAPGDSRIFRGGKELPSARAVDSVMGGDEIVAGEMSMLMQLENRSVVKVLKHSTVSVEGTGSGFSLSIRKGGVLNRVPSLSGGTVYEIRTPDAEIHVRGTEFGVLYDDGKTGVFVTKGYVNVKHIPTGIEYLLTEGYSTEVNGTKVVSPIKDDELMLMKSFSYLTYVESLETKKAEELQFVMEKLAASDKSVSPVKLTLEALKEKYGRIDEVQLYSGRKYTGVITSRGEIYRILTPAGNVTVPAKEVKGSRIIR